MEVNKALYMHLIVTLLDDRRRITRFTMTQVRNRCTLAFRFGKCDLAKYSLVSGHYFLCCSMGNFIPFSDPRLATQTSLLRRSVPNQARNRQKRK